MLHLK